MFRKLRRDFQLDSNSVLQPKVLFVYISGLAVNQDHGTSWKIERDENLNFIEPYPLTTSRHKKQTVHLNIFERSTFISVKRSISWLGLTAPPMCVFDARYLQQFLPQSYTSCLSTQAQCFSNLNRFGTTNGFPRAPGNKEHTISVFILSDGGRPINHVQLSFLCKILLDPLKINYPFYERSWMSHKCRRSVE